MSTWVWTSLSSQSSSWSQPPPSQTQRSDPWAQPTSYVFQTWTLERAGSTATTSNAPLSTSATDEKDSDNDNNKEKEWTWNGIKKGELAGIAVSIAGVIVAIVGVIIAWSQRCFCFRYR
ncbi:hypothetical protein V2G26_021265 [Clonostachys chloroleuca]